MTIHHINVGRIRQQTLLNPSGLLLYQGLAEGKPAQGTPLICDVRDVAAAHVAAAETPSASGRYIVSQRAPVTAAFVSNLLRVIPLPHLRVLLSVKA